MIRKAWMLFAVLLSVGAVMGAALVKWERMPVVFKNTARFEQAVTNAGSVTFTGAKPVTFSDGAYGTVTVEDSLAVTGRTLVSGFTTFTGKSGIATIPTGKDTVVVAVAGALTSDLVLCTLQRDTANVVMGYVPYAGYVKLDARGNALAPMNVGWLLLRP